MDIGRETALTHLRSINEYEFEHFVADLCEQYGWTTSVTSGSNDRGVDIIVEKNKPFHQKYFLQAKCWSDNNKVGGPDIRQYSSLRRQNTDVDAVVLVTTSTFSRQAKQEGKDLNVKLIDGSALYDILKEAEADNLITEYTEIGASSCTHCDNNFKNEDTLRNHLSEEHDYVECPHCSDVLQNTTDLQDHLSEEHNHNQCPQCNEGFQTEQLLRSHLTEDHDYMKCPRCGEVTQDNSALKSHLRRKHNESVTLS